MESMDSDGQLLRENAVCESGFILTALKLSNKMIGVRTGPTSVWRASPDCHGEDNVMASWDLD